MQTPIGHLSFCTNIFPGETWETHFDALKEYIPVIKTALCPERPLSIGLRLSNTASLQLSKEDALSAFREWLREQQGYILSINGFPYGNFHRSRVKDQVHAPDWTTHERLQYTLRLFRILAALLPEGMAGGVSTSPLSYKRWFSEGHYGEIREKATWNMVEVVFSLIQIHKTTGKVLHLDIEPEADGLIESSGEFLAWFRDDLMPLAIAVLHDRLALSESEAAAAVRQHVRLCYDVCHFAVGFEEAVAVLKTLKEEGIKIGRWQLSAALKITLPQNKASCRDVINELTRFNEPVYLHQVVARNNEGSLLRYADLPEALASRAALEAGEWRSHFHVPLFIKEYGLLQSTQGQVKEALALQTADPLCQILEVETYTWEVLPEGLKLPLAESISREMKWVMGEISKPESKRQDNR